MDEWGDGRLEEWGLEILILFSTPYFPDPTLTPKINHRIIIPDPGVRILTNILNNLRNSKLQQK